MFPPTTTGGATPPQAPAFPLAALRSTGAAASATLGVPKPLEKGQQPPATPPEQLTDEQLLEIFKRDKDECFAGWQAWERQFTRARHYVGMRQWLAPWSRQHGWRDANLPKGVPRPVTSKPKETVQAVRAMFTSLKLGVTTRPNGSSAKAVSTAATADDLAPVLHDLHNMNSVMEEFDYPFIVDGNALLHGWYNTSAGDIIDVPVEQCLKCQVEYTSVQINDAKQRCPACKGTDFAPVIDPATGENKVERQTTGKPVSDALSLLEVRFPLTYTKFADVPMLIRMRWREKRYFEEHADQEVRDLVSRIQWQKEPTERAMQIFQAMPYQNDMSHVTTGGASAGATTGGEKKSQGITEYELWRRPTPAHPEGLVMRVLGEANQIVLHAPSENLPGPLPYTDQKGNPIFTFAFGGYEHVGGRILASGALEPVMSKFDQLNKLDSIEQMIMMRMASPNVIAAKGSGVQWSLASPGLPGLVIEWDPGLAGPDGKPEFRPGIGPDAAFAKKREALHQEIEEGTGTYDVVRGAKPAGVEAFAALNLLVERGQARFANAFQSRANVYCEWYGWALEMERQYGPTERVKAIMSPTRTWQFKTFQRAQLDGDVTIIVEDGSTQPKTSLGQRAAIQHLNELGLIDPADSDQKYTIYQKFGQADLAPGLNSHVQMALQKQERFEQWIMTGGAQRLPQAPRPDQPGVTAPNLMDPSYPLRWRRWWDPMIHRQEFIKWCNSDTATQLFMKYPEAEGFVTSHIVEIGLALMQKMQGTMDPGGLAQAPPPAMLPPGGPGADAGGPSAGAGGGAAMAMANSNQNAAPVGNTAQPAMAV